MSGYAIANPTYAEFLHSLRAWVREVYKLNNYKDNPLYN